MRTGDTRTFRIAVSYSGGRALSIETPHGPALFGVLARWSRRPGVRAVSVSVRCRPPSDRGGVATARA